MIDLNLALVNKQDAFNKSVFASLQHCYDCMIKNTYVYPHKLGILTETDSKAIIDTTAVFIRCVENELSSKEHGYEFSIAWKIQRTFIFFAYLNEVYLDTPSYAASALNLCGFESCRDFTVVKPYVPKGVMKCRMPFRHTDCFVIETNYMLPRMETVSTNDYTIMLLHTKDSVQLHIPRYSEFELRTLRKNVDVSYVSIPDNFAKVIVFWYDRLQSIIQPCYEIIAEKLVDVVVGEALYASQVLANANIPSSNIPEDESYAVLLYKEAMLGEL